MTDRQTHICKYTFTQLNGTFYDKKIELRKQNGFQRLGIGENKEQGVCKDIGQRVPTFIHKMTKLGGSNTK